MIEYDIISSEWDLKERLNKGWEIVQTYYESGIQHESMHEPAQVFSVSTGIGNGQSGGYGYQNQQQQQITKSVPVVVSHPRFVIKRTPAAKTLYETSQRENQSANT